METVHRHQPTLRLTRRGMIGAMLACLTGWPSRKARARDDYTDIEWPDLIPKKDGIPVHEFRAQGVIEHGRLSAPFKQPTAKLLTKVFNGKRVRLGGYLVPFTFDIQGTKQFLLAPYVGACIHVPPPPANQLVLVSSVKPYRLKSLSDPVYVVGKFEAALAETQLANTGYVIRSAEITPYDF